MCDVTRTVGLVCCDNTSVVVDSLSSGPLLLCTLNDGMQRVLKSVYVLILGKGLRTGWNKGVCYKNPSDKAISKRGGGR